MPIYEYKCAACGELHEALQKFSDAPLTECPACGESMLQKKVSAAGFRLSGTGWYETDFKTGAKKNLAGEQASPDTSSGSADKQGIPSKSAESNSTAAVTATT
ncbi:MAG: zinc ribbon domain-containing protein [Pseudomonadales bacterium]|nr:zinc ribbon domain-containing protein [Pseudomonadales bacterium]